MLPRLIHDQIDKQDLLEEQLSDTIDKIIDRIDVSSLIQDTQGTLTKIIEEVLNEINEIAPEALNNGFEFADKIKKLQAKDKEITIQSGQDTQVNKEQIGAREDGNKD